MITGNETIGIFECAKLVVNNQYEYLGSAIFCVILIFILYVLFILLFMKFLKMKRFLKSKNLYEEFMVRELKNKLEKEL